MDIMSEFTTNKNYNYINVINLILDNKLESETIQDVGLVLTIKCLPPFLMNIISINCHRILVKL